MVWVVHLLVDHHRRALGIEHRVALVIGLGNLRGEGSLNVAVS